MANRMSNIARRLDRGLLPFMGPAQIGAGHPEEPYQQAADSTCPICHQPMAEHVIQRNLDPARATRLICPTPN